MNRIIYLILTLLLSGCALNHKPDSDYFDISLNQIDLKLNEKANELESPIILKSVWGDDISISMGKLYATKSAYIAHREFAFNGTYIFGAMGAEMLYQTSEPGAWLSGGLFLIITPIILAGELLYYPVRVIHHLSITDKEIDEAKYFLSLARQNGYTDEYMFLKTGYFKVMKNLDK